jgi:hypothetical protein
MEMVAHLHRAETCLSSVMEKIHPDCGPVHNRAVFSGVFSAAGICEKLTCTRRTYQ